MDILLESFVKISSGYIYIVILLFVNFYEEMGKLITAIVSPKFNYLIVKTLTPNWKSNFWKIIKR